jgi:hypothetical protein
VITYRGPAFASSLFAAPDLRRFASIKTSEFDQRFDDGESVLEALDLSQARRQRLEIKRVNVDFPLSMVEQLDREASRMGYDPSIDHQEVAG